jgi:aldehyde:ferredoxin oxidoreductase
MPDWEAMGTLGGNLGLLTPEGYTGEEWTPNDPYPADHWTLKKSLDELQRATFIHDNYGVDYIDNGMNLSLLMELMQRNLITAADLDGINLVWGNMDAVEQIMDKMCRREGIGDKIANGTYETAKYFAALKGNPDIMKYSMTTHRYGQPAHTVRGGCKSAISYITTIKPNCHTEGNAKGAALMGQQDVAYANNSAVICMFVRGRWGTEGMANMMTAATGWTGYTYDEFQLVGTRSHALGRIFEMYTQMNDPEFTPVAWDHNVAWRWFNEPFTAGPWPKGVSTRWEEGLTVDEDLLYNESMPEYYRARGATPTTGIPTEATLEELGIRDIAGSYAAELLSRYGE